MAARVKSLQFLRSLAPTQARTRLRQSCPSRAAAVGRKCEFVCSGAQQSAPSSPKLLSHKDAQRMVWVLTVGTAAPIALLGVERQRPMRVRARFKQDCFAAVHAGSRLQEFDDLLCSAHTASLRTDIHAFEFPVVVVHHDCAASRGDAVGVTGHGEQNAGKRQGVQIKGVARFSRVQRILVSVQLRDEIATSGCFGDSRLTFMLSS